MLAVHVAAGSSAVSCCWYAAVAVVSSVLVSAVAKVTARDTVTVVAVHEGSAGAVSQEFTPLPHCLQSWPTHASILSRTSSQSENVDATEELEYGLRRRERSCVRDSHPDRRGVKHEFRRDPRVPQRP